ncbi:MAG: allantoinase AllB [Planctomycetota bacterium]
MTMRQAFSIRSKRVLLPEGEAAATVRVRDGVIAAIDPYDTPDAEEEVVGDAVLMPGLVDTHVHLNEPGRADWEGFATGTAAARAGGFTTLIDMPLNSSPVTTDAEALSRKRHASDGKLSVDVGFYGGLVPGNADRMPELLDAGVRGVKAFLCHSGIDEFPNATEADLRQAMPILAERGVPLLVHAELVPDDAPGWPEGSDGRSYAEYLATRPPSFEQDAIAMMIRLCRETGCRTHLVHLADAGCLPMIAEAKNEGLPITVETCPHYLAFAAENIPDGFTLAKCAPPVRDENNRRALWDALQSGLIDMVVSDHSPAPPAMKSLEEGNFQKAWGGISSLQLGLSVVWKMAHDAGLPLRDVAAWMGACPAQLIDVPFGITPGHPAHFFVFDPDAVWAPFPDDLLHRHKLTPYLGMAMRGKVLRTYVHGQANNDTPAGQLV